MSPLETGSINTSTSCTSNYSTYLASSTVPVSPMQQSDITTSASFGFTEAPNKCGTITITATERTTITETETAYRSTSNYGTPDASLASATYAVHTTHSWPNTTTITATVNETTIRNTGTSAPAFSTATVAGSKTGDTGSSSLTAGVPQGPSPDGYNSTLSSSEINVESSIHAPNPVSTPPPPAGTALHPPAAANTTGYHISISLGHSPAVIPSVDISSTSGEHTSAGASIGATGFTTLNASSTVSWTEFTSTWQNPTTTSSDEGYPSTGQHGAPYTETCVRCTDPNQTPITDQSSTRTNTSVPLTSPVVPTAPPTSLTRYNETAVCTETFSHHRTDPCTATVFASTEILVLNCWGCSGEQTTSLPETSSNTSVSTPSSPSYQ